MAVRLPASTRHHTLVISLYSMTSLLQLLLLRSVPCGTVDFRFASRMSPYALLTHQTGELSAALINLHKYFPPPVSAGFPLPSCPWSLLPFVARATHTFPCQPVQNVHGKSLCTPDPAGTSACSRLHMLASLRCARHPVFSVTRSSQPQLSLSSWNSVISITIQWRLVPCKEDLYGCFLGHEWKDRTHEHPRRNIIPIHNTMHWFLQHTCTTAPCHTHALTPRLYHHSVTHVKIRSWKKKKKTCDSTVGFHRFSSPPYPNFPHLASPPTHPTTTHASPGCVEGLKGVQRTCTHDGASFVLLPAGGKEGGKERRKEKEGGIKIDWRREREERDGRRRGEE